MTAFSLKNALVQEAQAVGFDQVAVTTASPSDQLPYLLSWLKEGAHADMAWLAKDPQRRAQPRHTLGSAESLILLATNYFQGDEAATCAGGRRIARYAQGADYHNILRPRLEHLDAWLSDRGGIQRYYTDTGPILERAFAARAGLGWQGKSTMLLNRTLGKWFFISVILTSLRLPADLPSRNYCGSCTRCMTSCPTGAIDAPYHLDARRCIAWLTIENRGPIPECLRTAVGGRIFGCDECLNACPWNRFARQSRELAFHPEEKIRQTPTREFLSLDRPAFNKLFRSSPIKRAKYAGFLRNVCVALGNTGERSDLPALRHAAASPEPLIAEHAQWAIRQIEGRLHFSRCARRDSS